MQSFKNISNTHEKLQSFENILKEVKIHTLRMEMEELQYLIKVSKCVNLHPPSKFVRKITCETYNYFNETPKMS